MRGRAPQTLSYYSPVFLYAQGKPAAKRVIRDPIMGRGDLGTEADLIYAGPSARAKSPPLRRAQLSSSRDPIRGQGDLGEEHDPFQRTAKVRKVNGTTQSRAQPLSTRDPVRMTGDLGSELDHLNRSPKANRKGGKARPAQESYRDPIKGQGTLECYDKFRQGPERPKTPKFPQARRDPIKGEGDISEFDRITNGPSRPRSARTPRPEQVSHTFDSSEPVRTPSRQMSHPNSANRVHRDPIKGQGDFSTEVKVRGKKHTGPRPASGGGRNPISGTADIENQPPCGQHHRRHLGKTVESDPIRGTGADLKTYDITKESKARTPRPTSALAKSNPVSGENCVSFDMPTNVRTKSRGQYHSTATVLRNPITGVECDDYVLGSTMRSKRHVDNHPYRGNSSSGIFAGDTGERRSTKVMAPPGGKSQISFG